MTTLTGKKCGLLVNPCRLVITYQRNSFAAERRHSIPLRKFTAATDVTTYADDLVNTTRYKEYLQLIKEDQLKKLLNILQEHLSGTPMEESIDKYNTKVEESCSIDSKDDTSSCSSESHNTKEDAPCEIDSEEDLCILSDTELNKRKDLMKSSFEANQRKQGDTDYQYDVEIDFDHGIIETCDWDEDDDDMEF